MISKKIFTADGTTNRFLSDIIIRSEQFTRVYAYVYDNTLPVDGSGDVLQNPANPWSYPGNLYKRGQNFPNSAQDLLNLDKWDLADNSILLYTNPASGSNIYIEVATTAEEFGDTLTAPSVQRAEAARDAAETAQTAAETAQAGAETAETNANTSATNAASSATSAASSASSASTSASTATTGATTATTQAGIATTKATEASTSATNAASSATSASGSATAAATSASTASTQATNAASSASTATTQAGIATTKANDAQLRAWKAEAERMTADSYANEAEDMAVKIYTSDGDGTFTATPTSPAEYSSLHYSIKAQTAVSGATLEQPNIAAGSVVVEGVQLDLAITNYSADFTYVINATGCTVVNNAGTLEITNPTVANPSFNIKATLVGWEGEDSAITTRNLTSTLSTPVITPPADNSINTYVAYTYTVSDNSDTFVLNLGTTDYTYVGVTGGTLVSDTSGVITINGITGTSVTITVQFTVAATYSSVNGTSSDSAGNWTTSAASANDEIVIDSGVVVQTNFEVATYDGTGAAQTINLGVINTGVDVVLLKDRTAANTWQMLDTLRGATNRLNTDSTNAEAAVADGLTAFGNSNFSLSTSGSYNTNGNKYVAYTFSLPTDNASNTNGTITSVTKNNDFMSVVSWTSAGGGTVGHSLGKIPSLVITKRRNTTSNWAVSTNVIDGSHDVLNLNLTGAKADEASAYPTSTVFTDVWTNNDSMITYCFASVAGKCKIGSYTGNETTNPSIDCGFEPAWVMIKNTTNATEAGDWLMVDNVRNSDDSYLLANSAGAEVAYNHIDFTANGFDIITSGVDRNVNETGSVFIYMAIAKNPVRSPKTFDTELYTGNSSTQNIAMTNITDGVDFSWIKARSAAYSNAIFDSIRGATNRLMSDSTQLEQTESGVTAFNVSSIDLGSAATENETTKTYASWNFSLPTDTASNTDGSITSVTKNNDYMSIVSYTGTGANATVGHSLGKVPELVIYKGRTNVDLWGVYNKTVGNTKSLFLNDTGTGTVAIEYFNNTSPTSTTLSVGTDSKFNQSTILYIAYCFASVNGVCKVGKYTGTGTDNFIDCGFEPAFVMIKCTSVTSTNWVLIDNQRADNYLLANEPNIEASGDLIDINPTGFTAKIPAGDTNANTYEYIYLAISKDA